MPFISASTDAFLLTSVAVNVPLYFFFRRKPSPSESPYRLAFTVIVLLHTTYVIFIILLQWPPNIFSRLEIPLTMPSDTIRAKLLAKAGLRRDAILPKSLESLLTRMSSFDFRTLYVRFGQSVLQDCEYCTTYDEFALYALPGHLLEYVREAALLGFITITGSHRERWRIYAIAGIVCAAIIEGYLVAVQPVRIPRDGLGVFMLHDNLWICRQVLFLLLPLLIHATRPVASPPGVDLTTALLQIRTHAQAAGTRLTSLKYMRGAVMRDSSMRTASAEWWGKQKAFGETMREDEGVQRMAEKLGYGYVGGEDNKDSKLKVSAEGAVSALMAGLVPPGPVQANTSS